MLQVSRFPWWCSPCRLWKESLVFNFGPFDTLSDSLDPVSDSLLIMLRILGKIKRGPKVSRELYIAYVSRSTNRRYDIICNIVWFYRSANTRMRSKHIIIAHLSIQMYNMYTYNNYVYCARTRICAWIYTPCMQSTHNQIHIWWRWCIQCVFYTQSINLYDLCISMLRRGHISTFQRLLQVSAEASMGRQPIISNFAPPPDVITCGNTSYTAGCPSSHEDLQVRNGEQKAI